MFFRSTQAPRCFLSGRSSRVFRRGPSPVLNLLSSWPSPKIQHSSATSSQHQKSYSWFMSWRYVFSQVTVTSTSEPSLRFSRPFPPQIVSIDETKVIENVPDALAGFIPRVLLIPQESVNITMINQKQWTPEQVPTFLRFFYVYFTWPCFYIALIMMEELNPWALNPPAVFVWVKLTSIGSHAVHHHEKSSKNRKPNNTLEWGCVG